MSSSIAPRLALALASAVITLGQTSLGGCAAFEKMQRERLDKAVTVSAQAPLYAYRRVGFEPMVCEGVLCERINGADLMRVVRKSLTEACYEVVDDGEIHRYYEYFASASGMRLMDFGLSNLGMPGFKMSMLDPMMQHVVIDELGLDGMVKTVVNIGEPDEINGFRVSTIDVQLIDAHGRQVIWHGRLDGDVMEDDDASKSLSYLATELGGQVVAKASACGEPQAMPSYQVQAGLIELPDRVYFDLGSAQILSRSYPLLDDVALWLSNHSEVKLVAIEGHTDDIGDDSSNQTLSDERAKAVHAYLTQKGIDPARISAKGFGETRPLVANDNALNRSKNRRVEFRVMR